MLNQRNRLHYHLYINSTNLSTPKMFLVICHKHVNVSKLQFIDKFKEAFLFQ